MKVFKKIIAVSAALLLCLSFCPPALAASGADTSFAGKSWEDVVNQVLAECGVSPDSVAAGYCNLVTGEEHYLNGDKYLVAASMYKLPLNMYYAELIESGQLDWDSHYPNVSFEYVRDDTLINSNNDWAIFLWDNLGGYTEFKKLTAPYMGVDPDNADPEYYDNNRYTAQEFIHCLKLLYNESDRFPGIIQTMQKAEQERFFMLEEPRFNIAHKYCYVSENGHTYMNDCGLAFTEQPIAIVMFTDNVMNAEEILTAYCTAMCEYTNYITANPPPTPTPEPTAEPSAEPAAEGAADPAEETPSDGSGEREAASPVLPCVFIAVFLALGIAAALILKKRFGLSFVLTLLAVLFCAVAMLVSVAGFYGGTVYARTDGDPQQTVTGFFDSLIAGDYGRAYAQLKDYSSLGLETLPDTEAGQAACEALRESYAYELIGGCETDRLDAVQTVRFTYLDLPGLQDAVAEETQTQLRHLVMKLSEREIYDDNHNYRPEVTDKAYLQALQKVLENAQDYYTSADIRISLTYSDGRWQMIADSALLRALNGGTGY